MGGLRLPSVNIIDPGRWDMARKIKQRIETAAFNVCCLGWGASTYGALYFARRRRMLQFESLLVGMVGSIAEIIRER